MLKRKLNKKYLHEDSDGNLSKIRNKRIFEEDSPEGSLDLSYGNCTEADKSKYFPNHGDTEKEPDETRNTCTFSEDPHENMNIENSMLALQSALNDSLRVLQFRSPVEYVYNPLEYASKCNEEYIRKYCTSPKKLLFVGMNPGPFGMCQTGVPFGEIKNVRDWLGIVNEVNKPQVECPNRPVQGFDCSRSEVSGDRLWNLFKSICKIPEKFFANAFVYNYCPLAFMKADGCNVTPSDLKNTQELEEVCDRTYLDIIRLLQPEIIICIGRYVETRTKLTLKSSNVAIKIIYMTHPSPRAKNNQNWPEKAREFLIENDLMKYFL